MERDGRESCDEEELKEFRTGRVPGASANWRPEMGVDVAAICPKREEAWFRSVIIAGTVGSVLSIDDSRFTSMTTISG